MKLKIKEKPELKLSDKYIIWNGRIDGGKVKIGFTHDDEEIMLLWEDRFGRVCIGLPKDKIDKMISCLEEIRCHMMNIG